MTATSFPHSDQLGQTRPRGALVWYHAHDKNHVSIAAHLAERLAAERPDTRVLVTTRSEVRPEPVGHPLLQFTELPADRIAAGRAFLEQWSPDVRLWSVGNLRPNVLAAVHRNAIPMYLIDADAAHLDTHGWRWLPNAQKAVFRNFEVILARNASTDGLIRRQLSIKEASIKVSGPIWQEVRPLPYNEMDHDELKSTLLGRAVWLAAHVDAQEVDIVLKAHGVIMRRAHRVLLVLSPRSDADMDAVANKLRETELRYIRWSEGEIPDENTQVILADTPDELGLWYRIAPISFMGTSLLVGNSGTDPLEPAAHGSAILYGPNVRDHLETYSRLAEVGAARIIRDESSLATAVQRIIPADQSAAMAHAAWDVATRSAGVMDDIVEMLLDELDKQRGP